MILSLGTPNTVFIQEHRSRNCLMTGLAPSVAQAKGNSRKYRGEPECSPKRRSKMQKYQCNVCGYVYDPAVGDPDGGIEPGTSFDDLPEDWVCPECGVGKDMFEPVD